MEWIMTFQTIGNFIPTAEVHVFFRGVAKNHQPDKLSILGGFHKWVYPFIAGWFISWEIP
jgi:hypothetical protein